MSRAVVISGAVGGIGLSTTRLLAREGFTVFAGALNASEMKTLDAEAHERIVPLPLDVTKAESIDTAAAQIREALAPNGHLYGVINNAGLSINAPLQYLTVAEIQMMVNVNLIGPMLLTRGMLPLLQAGPSRVLIMGSASGIMTTPTVSVYGASKAGLAGLADALRLELAIAGISVSLIEPGVVRTAMSRGTLPAMQRMLDRMNSLDRKRYQSIMQRVAEVSSREESVLEPEVVANAVLEALTASKPKSRYALGIDCKAAHLLKHLPDAGRDFIQRKMFSF